LWIDFPAKVVPPWVVADRHHHASKMRPHIIRRRPERSVLADKGAIADSRRTKQKPRHLVGKKIIF